MSKIVNKLQLSNELKNSYNIAKSSGYCSNSPKGNALKQISANPKVSIENECNKPLQSNFIPYVNSKAGKASSIDLGYNSDRHYGVYRSKGNWNLWLCRDRQARPELSECEREQLRLYRQLKREYEKEQKLLRGEVVDETTITKQEKLQAVAKKQAIKLLNGLTCAPRYDRIYSAG